jgi:ABC-2 type transport system ATP-binding protein
VLGERVRPGASDVFTRVGYLVETATAYPNLIVRENLDIQRRLTGAPRAAVAEAIELMRLDAQADRRAGVLSLGYKQRLALARALLHRPELLILDEPANGLDPAGIVEVRELLQSLTSEYGVTVFMSSHILAEVAHLADRIGIVDEGHLLEELDRVELHARERGHVRVGASEPQRAAALLTEAGFAHVELADGHLRVFDAAERVPEIARVLVGAGIALTELAPAHEDLESYFLRLTAGVQ